MDAVNSNFFSFEKEVAELLKFPLLPLQDDLVHIY